MRRAGAANRLRIVGGSLRGRRIRFPDVPGLRTTGDRIRETLFNWLQPWISGSRCLDLFAGSGVLGLEARSRGAGQVVLVERDPEAHACLAQAIDELGIDGVQLVLADALAWLQGPPRPFDLVFLDPPFAEGLLARCCRLLEEGGWLRPGARVYLESDAAAGLPELPAGWALEREKRSGHVAYGLARRH